jgi:hypothetical protein
MCYCSMRCILPMALPCLALVQPLNTELSLLLSYHVRHAAFLLQIWYQQQGGQKCRSGISNKVARSADLVSATRWPEVQI